MSFELRLRRPTPFGADPKTVKKVSPDPASLGPYFMGEPLSGRKTLPAKLGHVGYDIVHPVFRDGVSGTRQARPFALSSGRACCAPRVGEGQKEFLSRCPAISIFRVQRFALRLQLVVHRYKRQSQSAVIGCVLALSQVAVLLDAGLRNLLGVLVGDALSALVVGFGIFRGPPVAQIPLGRRTCVPGRRSRA